MRFKIYPLIGFCFFFWGEVQAASSLPSLNYEITQKNVHTHVNFLSSDLLEGRLTGTIGEQLATQYIATLFRHLGLQPAGDNGTFFQEFSFTAGVSLGTNNVLRVNQHGVIKPLILNQDWRPLAFSDTTSFESSTLVFAGYGITAPALGKIPAYDSYKDLNVTNKWVVVWPYTPDKISAEQGRQLSQYSSARYKAFTAKAHGAKGIIFVSNKLIPLSSDTSLSGSGIVALSIKSNALDLKDSMQEGQVLDDFKISGQTDIEKNIQHGRNVLAKLGFGAPQAPLIVVGAHVDHLGRGQLSGSRARDDEHGMIHSGADDNASGVASVLEAAAKLSNLKAQGMLHGSKDILFAAWSGEEFGILGSTHCVKKLMEAAPNKLLRPMVDAVINLDMVGHLRQSLALQGTGSSTDWPQLIKRAQINHPITFITQKDPYLPTDSTAFYVQGVPTLNLFTGAHDEYHTPRDKPETLNYAGIKIISELLVSLIIEIEKTPELIAYNEVPRIRTSTERELHIYLGTIPDYTSSEHVGVAISGVAKSSPAEQAGLLPHDVIVELAGKSIHDIYDYTFALNALYVNKPVKLVVLRGQKKEVLTVVARYRD